MSRHVLVIKRNEEDDTFSIYNKVNGKKAFKVRDISQLKDKIIKAGDYLGWDGSKKKCPVRKKCEEFHKEVFGINPLCKGGKCPKRWERSILKTKEKIEKVLGSTEEEAREYENKKASGS